METLSYYWVPWMTAALPATATLQTRPVATFVGQVAPPLPPLSLLPCAPSRREKKTGQRLFCGLWLATIRPARGEIGRIALVPAEALSSSSHTGELIMRRLGALACYPGGGYHYFIYWHSNGRCTLSDVISMQPGCLSRFSATASEVA
ncbi:hypothetical protein EXIGLDRAFT_518592 [Exidia glandulosa HHB12029]|uniref:Uncharacterized protein n=1 Tax=Exidia glandulosa HHB12029 TaxID=1314781 RepID=A0A165J6M1_EXIGL|nr:hypothetical protein EXIGLDRAFT_518592 [Exidia glandulosa HHB12029]